MHDLLSCIGPEQFTLLAFLFAVTVSEDLNANDINSLGNFFSTAGSAMQLIAAQQELQKNTQG